MKALETSTSINMNAYVKGAESAAQPEAAKSPKQDAGSEVAINKIQEDKVNISTKSRDMQNIKNSMDIEPQARLDKVQDLKESVESGTYEVNAQKVADKMVGAKIDELV